MYNLPVRHRLMIVGPAVGRSEIEVIAMVGTNKSGYCDSKSRKKCSVVRVDSKVLSLYNVARLYKVVFPKAAVDGCRYED